MRSTRASNRREMLPLPFPSTSTLGPLIVRWLTGGAALATLEHNATSPSITRSASRMWNSSPPPGGSAGATSFSTLKPPPNGTSSPQTRPYPQPGNPPGPQRLSQRSSAVSRSRRSTATTAARTAPGPESVVRVHGRDLHPGTEVSISGERGRFRFIRATTTSTERVVLDFIGGQPGHECWRSFYPERIKSVYRLNRTRRNVAQRSPNARICSAVAAP